MRFQVPSHVHTLLDAALHQIAENAQLCAMLPGKLAACAAFHLHVPVHMLTGCWHGLLLDAVSCCSNGVMELTRGVRSQLQGLIRYFFFD